MNSEEIIPNLSDTHDQARRIILEYTHETLQTNLIKFYESDLKLYFEKPQNGVWHTIGIPVSVRAKN